MAEDFDIDTTNAINDGGAMWRVDCAAKWSELRRVGLWNNVHSASSHALELLEDPANKIVRVRKVSVQDLFVVIRD